jgi:hypothetical protein
MAKEPRAHSARDCSYDLAQPRETKVQPWSGVEDTDCELGVSAIRDQTDIRGAHSLHPFPVPRAATAWGPTLYGDF